MSGVDIAGELVEHCRNTYRGIENLNFEVADVRDLASLNRQIDSVVCMDVIGHFGQEEGPIVVKSLANVHIDRGMLIIGTLNVRSRDFASQRRRITHAFEHDYATFEKLLLGIFRRALGFSMRDEIVSTGFSQLAWHFMGVCVK